MGACDQNRHGVGVGNMEGGRFDDLVGSNRKKSTSNPLFRKSVRKKKSTKDLEL